MTDKQFEVNFKPSYLTRGLKAKLTSQVDYINANFNRGDLQEAMSMIDVMVSNLNYTKERIQKYKESSEKHKAMVQKQKETLDRIKTHYPDRSDKLDVRNWECPKCHEKYTFSEREIKSHFERYHPSEPCVLCKCHSLNLNEIRDPCGCKCHRGMN